MANSNKIKEIINESPFNVGLGIELPEFNEGQVRDLALRHGLDWGEEQVEQLMRMVGGHPYLIRVALYYISRREVSLPDMIKTAYSDAGLYSDHLRRHLWNLEQNPDLASSLKDVLSGHSPIALNSEPAFKLESMGLVTRQNKGVTPRCELYRQYFKEHLRLRV